MKRLSTLLGILALAVSGAAGAQYGEPQSLKAELPGGADLVFAKELKELGMFSSLANSVFTPAKDGVKRPAIVVFHTCSGIRGHVRQFAEQALQSGYVVLIVDAMRGMKTDCGSPPTIPNARLVKDALDAVAHLAGFAEVDPKRISLVGFSKGAIVAIWTASSKVADAVRPGTPPIAAAVAMYGLCAAPVSRARPQGVLALQSDTDRPLLLLLGGKDTETPPASCLERLPGLKAAGAPVEWHLYPDATHAWDERELNGFSKIAWNGERVVYLYDEAVTNDSRKRALEFIGSRKVEP
jgi:dienelactone hydrolase